MHVLYPADSRVCSTVLMVLRNSLLELRVSVKCLLTAVIPQLPSISIQLEKKPRLLCVCDLLVSELVVLFLMQV